jgi:hypothetical protein
MSNNRIINLIDDQEYLTDLFSKRITDIDPDGRKVLYLKSHFIKSHADSKFFHFVIQHDLAVETKDNVRKRYKLYCVSFSAHKRRRMFQTLELAYSNGFDKGDVIVPKPLWYVDDLMAAFYIGVPGENLLEHIKNGYSSLSVIKKIAAGLSDFHELKPASSMKLVRHAFSPKYLDPTNVINRSHNKGTNLANEVLYQYKKLKVAQKKLIKKNEYLLSHGDFHPENVIVNKFNNRQVALIDFSEVGLAPIYFDIASFLQQLQFMTLNYLTGEQYDQMEYVFCSTYFNKKKLPIEIKNKLNLYKSWTALKSTVYFMIFEDEINRGFAGHLLTSSENFYRQIK